MLKPLNLYLDGWLSYDKVELDLSQEGITQLKGPVGAGKSAIYEAVYYLLFGETLRKKSSVKDLANKILNKGYEIWLEFENNGHWYKIKEVRDRKDSGLWFWKDSEDETGLKLGKTNPETRKLIIKELGMTSVEFRSISFLGQRQSQVLVEGTSGDRGKCITSLYGLEQYDTPIKECDSDLKDALNEKKSLTEKIKDLEKDLTSLEESMKVEESIEDADPEQLAKLKEKKTTIEAKLEKIKEKEDGIREVIGKYNALKESKKKYNELNKEVLKLEKKLKELPKSEATTKDIDASIKEYRDKQAEIKAEIKQIEASVKELAEIGDLCPIDKKECPENRPETFRDQRREDLENKCSKCTKNLEGVEGCLKTWQKEKERKETYEEAEKEVHNKKLLRSQCMIQDLPNIEKEQEELGKCTEGRKVGKEKLEEVQEELKGLENKASLKKQQEKFKAKVERTLKEKKEGIEKTKKTLEDLSEDAEYLSASLNILRKLKNYRVDMILELLNKNLEDQLNEVSDIYKARFVSQRKDSRGKRFLDDLDLLVWNGQTEININLSSGGQSNLISVAVLLASWLTAAQISKKSSNALWLDEPFEYQDDQKINLLFTRITSVAKELGTTNIKIISHRDLDARLIDHVWDIDRVDGVSRLEI